MPKKGTVYKIEGINDDTGEVSTYVGQTNNQQRRMKEHTRSGLVDALSNDGQKMGLFTRLALGLLSIISYKSDDCDADEHRDIEKEKSGGGRNLNVKD